MGSLQQYRLNVACLQRLFEHFKSKHYQNIGPIYRDSAIMIDELDQFEEIPRGYYEKIDKGFYRIHKTADGSFFQYTVGPQSFKQFLHPVRRKLWTAKSENGTFRVENEETEHQPKVFWGIRSCDLSSIHVLDKVFFNQKFRNNYYEDARKNLVLIAVNCGKPSANCFCTTMDTGPKAKSGFDFALTEVLSENEHFFICECGNDNAVELCEELGFKAAEKEDIQAAKKILDNSAKSMEKRMSPKNVAKTLKENLEHKHWAKVHEKCLACANCTMVCPTCFCTATEDITDVSGDHSERWLRWDSCFHGDYSYIHGGVVRGSVKSRYRQWLTHKLSNWYDQFGTSGCVGCGRCITWCPVGIDLTEEVKALQS